MPVARRGEIWRVDLGIAGKIRPALILSVSFLDHERALFGIVPHTTSLRDTRFEVKVTVPGLLPGAFDAQGIKSIPATALMQRLSILDARQLNEVEAAVRAWFGLK